jgi:hypothetical protein
VPELGDGGSGGAEVLELGGGGAGAAAWKAAGCLSLLAVARVRQLSERAG